MSDPVTQPYRLGQEMDFQTRMSLPYHVSGGKIPTLFVLFTDIIDSSITYVTKSDEQGLKVAIKKFDLAIEAREVTKTSESIRFLKTMGDAIIVISDNPVSVFNFILAFAGLINKQNSENFKEKFFIRFTAHCGPALAYKHSIGTVTDCFGQTINTAARFEGENKKIVEGLEDASKKFPILISDEFYSQIKLKDTGIDTLLKKLTEKQVSIKEYNMKIPDFKDKQFWAWAGFVEDLLIDK